MIYYFDSLSSTNKYAKENMARLKHGDIVCAATQTAGRGRKNRVWVSDEGGLYFTVILKPQNLEHLANFTQLMAFCICSVLNKHGIAAYLKWPNDVLCSGQKLCGILSEVVFEGQNFIGLALGVGVNINSAPTGVDRPAGCLLAFGFKTGKDTLLSEIDTMFSINYSAFEKDGFLTIKTAYETKFPYIGKEVQVFAQSCAISGRVDGLSDKGLLILNTQSGRRLISLGDMD